MELLNYSQKYEAAVVELWNKSLTDDPISIHKFRKQALFDDNFNTELCFVAVDNGSLVAFLLATKRKFPYLERGLEPTRGWINVMFVEEAYRRKGIGEALVKKAENKLKEMGAENITLGSYSPNYFFPGIDKNAYACAIKFFEKMGYVSGEENFSMCKDLHGYKHSEDTVKKLNKAKQAGFSFINFDYKYALKLLEFGKKEFGGGWKRNLLISMQNNTAEDSVLIVLDKDENIVGFSMRAIDGNSMRFGPIGVKSEIRSFGIGGILFDIMQMEMAKRGIYHLYFVSTDEPGRRFYERHGVKVFRVFTDYKKNL